MTVEVVETRSHVMKPNWCTRCAVCKQWLSKFDFTAEESRRIGEGEKRKGECRCGR